MNFLSSRAFPGKRTRCAQFGARAADRSIRVSAHAPYFAVLTVEEPQKAHMCLAALEHTMKLGKELGSPLIVAHAGHLKGRAPQQVMDLIRRRLETLGPKVENLGVGLGWRPPGICVPSGRSATSRCWLLSSGSSGR